MEMLQNHELYHPLPGKIFNFCKNRKWQPKTQKLALWHKIFFLLWGIFIKNLVDSACKQRKFFCGKRFYYFNSLVSLLLRKAFGGEAGNKFLHIKKFIACLWVGRFVVFN